MSVSDLEYLESVSEASEIVGGAGTDFTTSIKLNIASLKKDDIPKKVDEILNEVAVKRKEPGNKVVAYASVKTSKGGRTKVVTKVTR